VIVLSNVPSVPGIARAISRVFAGSLGVCITSLQRRYEAHHRGKFLPSARRCASGTSRRPDSTSAWRSAPRLRWQARQVHADVCGAQRGSRRRQAHAGRYIIPRQRVAA
jgi:hypothetical protein